MFVLKLHRKVVYRLSLYQVLASLAFSTVQVWQIISAHRDEIPEFGRACTAIGSLVLYFRWVKLLFTMWVTFHLFCFAVLHKNLKKLEGLYVVTSLLVPTVIVVVPLITISYGLSPFHYYCYIYLDNDTNHIASTERFALWDAPAMALLLAASIAMVAMVTKLARSVCWRLTYEPITDGGQYWKALKQLLPLAAFPTIFFVFIIPGFINDIYLTVDSNLAAYLCGLTFIALWSMASGVTLLVHISVSRCSSKRGR